MNQLENGLCPDLGVKKLQAVLEKVGLTLSIQNAPKAARPDFIRMACTAANVSHKTSLTEDELIHVLISGKIPNRKRPHLRTLLDEAAPALLQGLVKEASRWTKPGRVEKNLAVLAREIGASGRVEAWLRID